MKNRPRKGGVAPLVVREPRAHVLNFGDRLLKLVRFDAWVLFEDFVVDNVDLLHIC